MIINPFVFAIVPVTAFTKTLSGQDLFTGFTGVARVTAAQMTIPGYSPTQIRVTLRGGSTNGLVTNGVFVGHQATSGDAMDFAAGPAPAAPVQLLFGGSGSVSAPASTDVVSDWMNFTWDKVSNLLIACQASGTTYFASEADAAFANWYKPGADAATVNKTGYTGPVAGHILVRQIEFR